MTKSEWRKQIQAILPVGYHLTVGRDFKLQAGYEGCSTLIDIPYDTLPACVVASIREAFSLEWKKEIAAHTEQVNSLNQRLQQLWDGHRDGHE